MVGCRQLLVGRVQTKGLRRFGHRARAAAAPSFFEPDAWYFLFHLQNSET